MSIPNTTTLHELCDKIGQVDNPTVITMKDFYKWHGDQIYPTPSTIEDEIKTAQLIISAGKLLEGLLRQLDDGLRSALTEESYLDDQGYIDVLLTELKELKPRCEDHLIKLSSAST